MKRIVFLLIVLLMLVSCGQKNQIPEFESFPITLSGTLTCNDSSCAITAVMQDKDSCHITIDSPELLRGYSFKVDNSGVSVYYDDMQIELKTGVTDIPLALLPKMLDVKSEDFEYSRKDSENTIYYYTKNSADTVIYIKKGEKLPGRIEYISGGYVVTLDIESFIIQQGDINADLQ